MPAVTTSCTMAEPTNPVTPVTQARMLSLSMIVALGSLESVITSPEKPQARGARFLL